MHFIEISNIFNSEKKRYKVTAVLKLLVVFALLGFFLSNKPMYHVQTDFYLKRMGFVFLACFWMVFVTVCDIRLSQKVDSKGDATKVKFVVKNKTDNYYLVARADRAGVYQVTGKSAKEADATQFSPSSDGKLVINGIEGDEYGFTETHSDAGYSLLKKEVIVKVKETKADITPTEANITGIQSKSDADSTANDGVPNGAVLKNDVTVQTTAASATVDETKATMTKHDDSGNAYINMQITNQKQFMLPMTGGAGNYLLIIAGVVVAGCGILILNKNRGRSQR